jgi:O-antigen ligase
MSTAAMHSTEDRSDPSLAALGAAALAIFLVTPRASPLVLALLVLSVGLAARWAFKWDRLARLPMAGLLVLALAGWGLISVAWAADKSEALSKSAMLAAFAAAAGAAQLGLKQAGTEKLRLIARAGLIAFAVAVVYLVIEEISEHAIKRLLFMALPFTKPVGKLISDNDGDMIVAAYISNRNMAALALVLFPMLLLIRVLVERRWRLAASAGALALVLLSMALSKHETSLIALGAAALVLAACRVWPKLGLSLLAAGWAVATLLVVPLVGWAKSGPQLQHAAWLPNSARHRIVLWAYTAEQVQQRPIAGIGAASTKLVDARRGPKVEPLAGTRYEWRSGPHAHNVYLQTWYELGAVGALLLCAAGLALVAVLSRLPPVALPCAAAAMTTAAVIGAFSWGMWQAWFLGAFAVSAVLTALAVELMRAGDGRREAT